MHKPTGVLLDPSNQPISSMSLGFNDFTQSHQLASDAQPEQALKTEDFIQRMAFLGIMPYGILVSVSKAFFFFFFFLGGSCFS